MRYNSFWLTFIRRWMPLARWLHNVCVCVCGCENMIWMSFENWFLVNACRLYSQFLWFHCVAVGPICEISMSIYVNTLYANANALYFPSHWCSHALNRVPRSLQDIDCSRVRTKREKKPKNPLHQTKKNSLNRPQYLAPNWFLHVYPYFNCSIFNFRVATCAFCHLFLTRWDLLVLLLMRRRQLLFFFFHRIRYLLLGHHTHCLCSLGVRFLFCSSSCSLYSEMARWRMCKAYHLSLTTHTHTYTHERSRTHTGPHQIHVLFDHDIFMIRLRSVDEKRNEKRKEYLRVYRARSLRAALQPKKSKNIMTKCRSSIRKADMLKPWMDTCVCVCACAHKIWRYKAVWSSEVKQQQQLNGSDGAITNTAQCSVRTSQPVCIIKCMYYTRIAAAENTRNKT